MRYGITIGIDGIDGSDNSDIPELQRVCLYCRRDVVPNVRGEAFCCRRCARRYRKTLRHMRDRCETAHKRIRYLLDMRGAWEGMDSEIETILRLIQREIAVALED